MIGTTRPTPPGRSRPGDLARPATTSSDAFACDLVATPAPPCRGAWRRKAVIVPATLPPLETGPPQPVSSVTHRVQALDAQPGLRRCHRHLHDIGQRDLRLLPDLGAPPVTRRCPLLTGVRKMAPVGPDDYRGAGYEFHRRRPRGRWLLRSRITGRHWIATRGGLRRSAPSSRDFLRRYVPARRPLRGLKPQGCRKRPIRGSLDPGRRSWCSFRTRRGRQRSEQAPHNAGRPPNTQRAPMRLPPPRPPPFSPPALAAGLLPAQAAPSFAPADGAGHLRREVRRLFLPRHRRQPYRDHPALPVSGVDLHDERRNPVMTFHVGDINLSERRCDSAYMTRSSGCSISSRPPSSTPPDNNWTDCSQPVSGGLQPAGQPKLRSVMYPVPDGLGQAPIPCQVQSSTGFPENVRVIRDGVVLVVVHTVGENDDLLPWAAHQVTPPRKQSRPGGWPARSTRSRRRSSRRRDTGSRAVTILLHVDMFDPTHTPSQAHGLQTRSSRR